VSGGRQYPINNGRSQVTILVDNYTNDTNDKQQATQEDPISIVLFIMDDMDVEIIRKKLRGHTITLRKLDDQIGIFDQVDTFVNLSRGNKTVEEVTLYPFTDSDGTDFRRSVISILQMEILRTTKRIRLPLTGRFWLASCDVFGGVSIYA
jgi:hypothetical protein